MKIIIVDEEDSEIGFKERGKIDYETDIYRVSALWIVNSSGQSLLAKRSLNKSHHPGKWGPAVAGTVEKEESYEKNIKKESEEELGLKMVGFKPFFKEFVGKKRRHFTQWFFMKSDLDIEDLRINPEEVDEVKWFNLEEIRDLIKRGKTVTFSDELIRRLREYEI